MVAAPVNELGAPVDVLVGEPIADGEVRNVVAVEVDNEPTIEVAVAVLVLVLVEDPFVELAVSTLITELKELLTAAFVLVTEVVAELAPITGPPGVVTVAVDSGDVDVVTVTEVDTLGEEDATDEEER